LRANVLLSRGNGRPNFLTSNFFCMQCHQARHLIVMGVECSENSCQGILHRETLDTTWWAIVTPGTQMKTFLPRKTCRDTLRWKTPKHKESELESLDIFTDGTTAASDEVPPGGRVYVQPLHRSWRTLDLSPMIGDLHIGMIDIIVFSHQYDSLISLIGMCRQRAFGCGSP
jgi:hypothetical protein